MCASFANLALTPSVELMTRCNAHQSTSIAHLLIICKHLGLVLTRRDGCMTKSCAIRIHRFEMSSARDELDVRTTPGQQGAEIPAEATRSHNRYPHRSPTQLRPSRAVKSLKPSERPGCVQRQERELAPLAGGRLLRTTL